jgi:hypothetical protein
MCYNKYNTTQYNTNSDTYFLRPKAFVAILIKCVSALYPVTLIVVYLGWPLFAVLTLTQGTKSSVPPSVTTSPFLLLKGTRNVTSLQFQLLAHSSSVVHSNPKLCYQIYMFYYRSGKLGAAQLRNVELICSRSRKHKVQSGNPLQCSVTNISLRIKRAEREADNSAVIMPRLRLGGNTNPLTPKAFMASKGRNSPVAFSLW